MNEWLECDLSELRIQYRDRLADLGFAHRATMAAEAERDAAIARAERAEAALATMTERAEEAEVYLEAKAIECDSWHMAADVAQMNLERAEAALASAHLKALEIVGMLSDMLTGAVPTSRRYIERPHEIAVRLAITSRPSDNDLLSPDHQEGA